MLKWLTWRFCFSRALLSELKASCTHGAGCDLGTGVPCLWPSDFRSAEKMTDRWHQMTPTPQVSLRATCVGLIAPPGLSCQDQLSVWNRQCGHVTFVFLSFNSQRNATKCCFLRLEGICRNRLCRIRLLESFKSNQIYNWSGMYRLGGLNIPGTIIGMWRGFCV